jgi:YgiT-type zinc finger domain-containing protein
MKLPQNLRCPECKTLMKHRQKKSYHSSSAGKIHVPKMNVMICPKCGETAIPKSEIKKIEKEIVKKKKRLSSLAANSKRAAKKKKLTPKDFGGPLED